MYKKLGILLLAIILVGTAVATPLDIRPSLIDQEEFNSANLYGKVTNNLGIGLYGATVTARNLDTDKIYTTTTDPKGLFGLSVTRGKTYEVNVNYNGNVKNYDGLAVPLSGKRYVEVKLAPSTSLNGDSTTWKWINFNHSKVAKTDFLLSRLYIGEDQYFKSLAAYPLQNSGINCGKGKGYVGSKITGILNSSGIATFNTANASINVIDKQDGYFYINFNDDGIVEVVIPEEFKVSEFSGYNPQVIKCTSGIYHNTFVLIGNGEIRNDRDKITFMGKKGSVLMGINEKDDTALDEYVSLLASKKLSIIIDFFSFDNETTVVPVILNPECKLSNMILTNDSFSFNVSTSGKQKAAVLLRTNSSEYQITSLTVDNSELKKTSTLEEAYSLAIVPKTATIQIGNENYQYIVMPDTVQRRIQGSYTKK